VCTEKTFSVGSFDFGPGDGGTLPIILLENSGHGGGGNSISGFMENETPGKWAGRLVLTKGKWAWEN